MAKQLRDGEGWAFPIVGPMQWHYVIQTGDSKMCLCGHPPDVMAFAHPQPDPCTVRECAVCRERLTCRQSEAASPAEEAR